MNEPFDRFRAVPSHVEGQEPKALPAPVGVVYNTSMSRPDAALALAALHVLASRRDARVDGVCVTGAGLDAAIFCDVVARAYAVQTRMPSSNGMLPIGLSSPDAPAASAPMVRAVVDRKRDDGQPQFVRAIQRVADTAQAEALLRNAVTFSAETVVLLSAPAGSLLKSLELAGSGAQYKQRVKRTVIVEAGVSAQDATATSAALSPSGTPVFVCGREVGEALSAPLSRIDSGLSWAASNPVLDACKASGQPTIALHDLAALHYALHPASGFFTAPDTGALRRLAVAPGKAEDCVAALVALATSKPAAPPPRAAG
jgi:hypothetical protein